MLLLGRLGKREGGREPRALNERGNLTRLGSCRFAAFSSKRGWNRALLYYPALFPKVAAAEAIYSVAKGDRNSSNSAHRASASYLSGLPSSLIPSSLPPFRTASPDFFVFGPTSCPSFLSPSSHKPPPSPSPVPSAHLQPNSLPRFNTTQQHSSNA